MKPCFEFLNVVNKFLAKNFSGSFLETKFGGNSYYKFFFNSEILLSSESCGNVKGFLGNFQFPLYPFILETKFCGKFMIIRKYLNFAL
jgi:hypothetical protein